MPPRPQVRPEGPFAPPSSRAEFAGMWRRQLRWWHAVYAAVWLTAVAQTLAAGPPRTTRPLELALLTGMAAAYTALGIRGIRDDDRRWAIGYHLVSWGLLFAVELVNPHGQTWVLFFVLFPHLWAMLGTAGGVMGTILAVLGFGGVQWWQEQFDPALLPAVLAGSLVSLGMSLGLGLFINRIIHEAEQRADTIDELRATQARLAAVERDRGVHDERERLSREIHDTLAQGFTSVLTLTRAARAALARGDLEMARQRLDLVEQTAADNLAEARLIVAELTPGHLQSRTLGEALGRLVAAFGEEGGIPVRLVVEGEPRPLGGSAEVVLLRSAQEGLANVRRHARARAVDVRLQYAADRVRLDVSDDGVGFRPDARAGGFGLDGIEARAAELGGSATITSVPGGGTILRVELPESPRETP